ncbi:putative endo-1,3(4)-beta-glucanase [Colletotrichum orbiculare MAFF 240422]|uniref:glucan endo-1,3-beta-D-glucosidase n=1 Tax=Colletotrichum orbiculare (strain 104-T / ATCC 96160 / CBS 514.97 / LARS 414 / MAFF 240422) TaxID=1213857 RepID=N4VS58_COLOR|nr:putative endo-1,3(4)-beta-glucanase [Colletotrichum orbiculare MAFF 240422]
MLLYAYLTAALALAESVSSHQFPHKRHHIRGLPPSGPSKPKHLDSRRPDDVFAPLPFDRPILVPLRDDHPQKPVGVKHDGPIQTNKFYANFFVNKQDNATWTHPYSVWWSNDTAKQGHGLSVTHTDRDDFIYGAGKPVKSFEDPPFRQSIALSARELRNGTVLTTDSLTAFSVNVNLAPFKGAKPVVSFPLVQGMGFVTGVYHGASVVIQSERRFQNLTDLSLVSRGLGDTVYGWSARLGDGSNWLIYMTPGSGSKKPTLRMTNKGTLTGPKGFTGTVQVAKNPRGRAGVDVFNKGAGVYPTGATISGTVSGRTGTYTIAWNKGGIQDIGLLMFALPHHVRSFDEQTKKAVTEVTLASTTKGMATAVFADAFTMVEDDLPTDMGFDPWSPRYGSVGSRDAPGGTVSEEAKLAIARAAKLELAADITSLTNLTSKYYAGIAFSKYARALYAMNNIAEDTTHTARALRKLVAAFDRYVNNAEPNPLYYDTVWKGLVSSGSYGNGDSSVDFGNTYYNDHNFHYGYYVYTAAVIAHLDPAWLTRNSGAGKMWVDNLVRDWANPSADDPFFPFSRAFDWFHGHSWARGVLEAPDGKDQESSAEDAFSTYAIKMWGRASGNAAMEARGNLQLAVNARSLQSYYLLERGSDVQPPAYVGNRVAGILFERKVNHTTWFGDDVSFIHGIHMLPIVPSSAYVRKAAFVRDEWERYFAGNETGYLTGGGFVGHVYVNLAIADQAGAVESYNFMRKQTVNSTYLDGLSLAWNLAYTAALGGSLSTNSSHSSLRLGTNSSHGSLFERHA